MDLPTKTLSFLLILISFVSSAQLDFETASVNDDDKSDLVVTDITAPRTDLLRTENGKFIFGPATRIKFKIIEEESGIASTNFKIANLPYMKSDGRQMVPHQLVDGSYKIEYYSVDNEGNQEQIRTNQIYIDKNGPEISAGFNTSPASFENGLPIFKEDVQLIIEVADEQVDVQKLSYQINDGPVVRSSEVKYLDLTQELKKKEYSQIKIEIRAYDSFYNLSKQVVEFKIAR